MCVDAISRGNVTDVVYLDFQKVFDTVPHKRPMVKLQAYGISGVILNWIDAFLNGRTQRVIVNGIVSRKEAVLSGVPQESVLGPLLFVLDLNDLPDTLVCHCMMFADDTKRFREITDVADMNMLQNDLHLMEKWLKLGSCCCLPTPMTLASGGSPMFPLVVHQPASPSIWPAVQSLRQGLSTNPGATMWCVCGCS